MARRTVLLTICRRSVHNPRVTVHPGYALALEEARRGFDQLAAEVSLTRDRAVSMVGLGGLAAAFLGGLSIRDGADVSRWTWLAVVAFVAMAVCAAFVLYPRRFHFSQHPGELVSWVEEHGASADDVERDLALWLGKKYDENRSIVDRLGRFHYAITIAFLVEIAALAVDLASR